MMKSRIIGLTALVLALFPLSAFADPPIELTLIESKKIWDYAPCNAFTDLVRYDGMFYATFREGSSHVSDSGIARVIRSTDGESWESVAELNYSGWDVRDPKISVTSDNRLMVNAFTTDWSDIPGTHKSLAWFSGNGADWTDGPHEHLGDNRIIWRVAWHPDGNDVVYGAGYCGASGGSPPNENTTRLYRSTDGGLSYETIVDAPLAPGNSNEIALLFRQDDQSAVALVREGNNRSYIGVAEGDYTNWTFHELDKTLGGPALLELPDGSIIAGTRYPSTSTSLCWLDPEGGELVQLLQLPSGGDTGYPGLVWHDGFLWVSYYSRHTGGPDIYFAKVAVTFVPEPTVWIMLISGFGLAALYVVRRRQR
jgi:hypothetical protein